MLRIGRSGEAAKSVTNLEYLSARAKGIPIYAFAEKSVLTLASVWESDNSVNLSKHIDNPKVFEFIKAGAERASSVDEFIRVCPRHHKNSADPVRHT